MDRLIRNMIGFLFGLAIISALSLWWATARSDDALAPPVLVVGVAECKKIVAVWVFTSDDKVRRFDETIPQTDAQRVAFLSWLADAKATDIYVKPCQITAAQ